MADKITMTLSAPLAEVLLQVGQAIIESQTAIDAHSLYVSQILQETKDELGTALSAPWFHIPEVEVDVKVALEYREKEASKDRAGYRHLYGAPINGVYQNLRGFDVNAASNMKVTFRSVPDQT